MTKSVLGKWGDSLGVRIPREIAGRFGWVHGSQVEIEAVGNGLLIRPTGPRITAAELFRGRSAAEWRAEYAGAYEWGPISATK